MIIRPVEESDAVDLRENCFSRNTTDEIAVLVRGAIVRADAGEGMMLVGVAEDGTVLANVSVSRRDHVLKRHRAELGGFVIHPSAQGTGLARKLTRAAAEWCETHGCSILEAECRGGTRAEDAYRGLGFSEWGRLQGGFVEEAGTFDHVNFAVVVSEWLSNGR